jgi:hypothetical protein
VHEAGHAVAAMVRGGEIKSIHVDPKGDILGEVYAEFRHRDWRSLTIFLMAGFWAQHHIADCRYPWGYSAIDQQLWTQTLRANGASKGAEQRCFQSARQIVLDYEAMIVAVAQSLQAGHEKDHVCTLISEMMARDYHGKHKTGARRRH